MTFEEARAQFPVFERYAYLNAGTNGPLAPRDRRRDGGRRSASTSSAAAAARAYFERALGAARRGAGEARRRGRARRRSCCSLTTSTTNGCNIVLAGLGLGAGRRGGDDRRRALRAARARSRASPAQVRVAPVRELPPEESLEVLLARGDAADAAARALARVLDERQPLSGRGAEGGDRPAGARRRRAVGRRDRRSTRRAFDYYAFSCQKWLCGPDATGGARRARPRGAARCRRRATSRRQAYEPTGDVHAAGRRRALRLELDAAAVAGRPRRPRSTSRPRAASSGRSQMAARCRELLARARRS